MWILIPSYEPTERLVELVAALPADVPVLIVDDGSGDNHAQHFEACSHLGAVVLHHPRNRGKAAALRTGFAWIERHAPGESVVCADSDGQHRPDDILAVGAALDVTAQAGKEPGVVLGVRAFDGKVPLRSRVGNRLSSGLVALATRRWLRDTQTGLRGYPPSLLRWAQTVDGERFSYELRLLLAASRAGIPMREVPISTVYLNNNESSHFRPVVDSLRVMAPLAAFAAVSLVSFGIDLGVLLGLHAAFGSLAIGVVGARLVSGAVNFALNRSVVFGSRGALRKQLGQYVILAATLATASYALLSLALWLCVPLVPAKIVTDGALWAASFLVQRIFVFPHQRSRPVQVRQRASRTPGAAASR